MELARKLHAKLKAVQDGNKRASIRRRQPVPVSDGAPHVMVRKAMVGGVG